MLLSTKLITFQLFLIKMSYYLNKLIENSDQNMAVGYITYMIWSFKNHYAAYKKKNF